MSKELPKGWVSERIANLAMTKSGGTPSTAKQEYWEGGDVPWINSGALKDAIISEPSTYITKLGLENSSAKLFPSRTVVIALTGATTGKVGLLNLSTSTNQSVTGIFPSSTFIPEYLFYYLRLARDFVLEPSIGSAQPHINKQIVDDIEVPLAPINEQKRIVSKLEKLLGKANISHKQLEKIPIILKRFRQSVLAAACSGRLTADWRKGNTLDDGLPTMWKQKKLEDLCELITKGASPKWQGVNYSDKGVLFVTSENVGIGKLLLDTKKYVEPKINEIQPRSILRTGDLLTNIVGASIGRSAIFDLDYVANINQAVALIRLKNGIEHKYILYVLNSPLLLKHMDNEKVDVARANLSLKDVSGFPVSLPPVNEQQEIVRRVEKLFTLTDKIEARYNKAKVQIDKLTQSILAKAFRGELVPQDPNDEPASVLLSKIKIAKDRK